MGTSEADFTLFQANKVFKETSEVSTNDLGEKLPLTQLHENYEDYEVNGKLLDINIEKSHTRSYPQTTQNTNKT